MPISQISIPGELIEGDVKKCCDLLRRSKVFLNGVQDFIENSNGKDGLRDFERELEVIIPFVHDFGFYSEVPLQDLYNRAYDLGFRLFTPLEAVAFRIGYGKQRMNDKVYIGIEPVFDVDREKKVLCASRDPVGYWLFSTSARSEFCSPQERWAFIISD